MARRVERSRTLRHVGTRRDVVLQDKGTTSRGAADHREPLQVLRMRQGSAWYGSELEASDFLLRRALSVWPRHEPARLSERRDQEEPHVGALSFVPGLEALFIRHGPGRGGGLLAIRRSGGPRLQQGLSRRLCRGQAIRDELPQMAGAVL